MSFFWVTLLVGAAFIAAGTHLLWHGPRSEKPLKAFPRSRPAAYVTMGLAAAWFLYEVTQLGPADFGQYKNILFLVFLGVAVGSFYFVPDFLAVRGLAALLLLVAGAILQAGYMNYHPVALLLKVFVYLGILVALVLGASPYKMRDFLDWFFRSATRPRSFGAVAVVCGLSLIAGSFFY